MIFVDKKTERLIERTSYYLTVVFLFSIPISIAISQTALFTAFVLTVFTLFKKGEIRTLRSPIDAFFLFYVGAEILSTIFAVDKFQSLILAKRLFLIAAFYLVRAAGKDESDLGTFLSTFILGVLVMAAVGV